MKTAVFIDGANVAATCKVIGYLIDFKKLLHWVDQEHDLLRAFYYTAVLEDADGVEFLRTLRDWLEYNGYRVVTKPAKTFTDFQGRVKVKGNMDIELAVDMMAMAPHLEHIMLFSGDGDFRYVVAKVQDLGCKVTVVSTVKSPSMIADELRRQADVFLDLDRLRNQLCR